MLPKLFSSKHIANMAGIEFTRNIVLLANILILMFTNVSIPAEAEEAWREHRNQAIHFAGEGDFVKAEKLFLQALSEARSVGNTPVIIEILSRLASLNILYKSLQAAEPYYQEAIRLTVQERQKPKHDPEIDVFMIDLAETYYSKSNRTANVATKEYCVLRYAKIELTVAEKNTPAVSGSISRLHTFYCMTGRNREAEQLWEERNSAYLRMTAGKPDPAFMPISFQILVNIQIAAHEFDRATESLKQYSHWAKLASCDATYSKNYVQRQLGIIAFLSGDYPKAIEIFEKLITSQKSPDQSTSHDLYVLGLAFEKSNNLGSAEKYLSDSVSTAHKAAGVNAEQAVVPSEELADLLIRIGDKKRANALKLTADTIRSSHHQWSDTPLPQQKDHFLIWGVMPFTVSISDTTHTDRSL